MNILFAKGKSETNKVSNERLYVNNCGYYRDIKEKINTRRTDGRVDYHLIFVGNGKLHYADADHENGSVVLFLPGDKQEYSYLPEDKCLYYWVHFSGTDARAVVESFGLRRGIFRVEANRTQIETLFRMMIDSYTDNLEFKEQNAAALLYSILALTAEKKQHRSSFGRAVKLVENFEEPLSVEQLAQSFNMSEGHFIRAFKQATGYPPYAYRLRCQTEYARALLTNTTLSVSKIAKLSGFDDPLYFSRIFKKRVGYSPTKYRVL